VELREIATVEGGSAQFACTVFGVPNPQLVWLKDHVKIAALNNPRYELSELLESNDDGVSQQLLIKDCVPQDAALWACLAHGSSGSALSKATLIVKQLRGKHSDTTVLAKCAKRVPEFTLRLKNRFAILDQPLSLSCSVFGIPQPQVRWYFEGQLLSAEDAHLEIRAQGGHHELMLLKCSRDVLGRYEAVACNAAGESKSSTLVTEHPESAVDIRVPCFTKTFSSLTVVAGEEVVFEAAAEGEPTPTLKWDRDTFEIFENSSIRKPRVETVAQSNGRSQLIIRDARKEDEGLYTVTACNKYGRTKHGAFIWINEYRTKSSYDDRPPASVLPKVVSRSERLTASNDHDAIEVVRAPQREIDLDEGQSFELIVELSCRPFVIFSWQKAGRALTYDQRRRITRTDALHSLSVDRALIEDSGLYHLVAETEDGTCRQLTSTRINVNKRKRLRRYDSKDSTSRSASREPVATKKPCHSRLNSRENSRSRDLSNKMDN